MEKGSSDIDGEAYAADVVDAVTNSVVDNDHKFAREITREVSTHDMYTVTGITESVKTGGTITVELETPKASVTVELEEDHPAIEDIEMGDYRGGHNEEANPSITERLNQE